MNADSILFPMPEGPHFHHIRPVSSKLHHATNRVQPFVLQSILFEKTYQFPYEVLSHSCQQASQVVDNCGSESLMKHLRTDFLTQPQLTDIVSFPSSSRNEKQSVEEDSEGIRTTEAFFYS
jgi:ssRNA-specific RNase YbeY (16S rRNA maturation enzyme)